MQLYTIAFVGTKEQFLHFVHQFEYWESRRGAGVACNQVTTKHTKFVHVGDCRGRGGMDIMHIMGWEFHDVLCVTPCREIDLEVYALLESRIHRGRLHIQVK